MTSLIALSAESCFCFNFVMALNVRKWTKKTKVTGNTFQKMYSIASIKAYLNPCPVSSSVSVSFEVTKYSYKLQNTALDTKARRKKKNYNRIENFSLLKVFSSLTLSMMFIKAQIVAVNMILKRVKMTMNVTNIVDFNLKKPFPCLSLAKYMKKENPITRAKSTPQKMFLLFFPQR